MQERQEISVGIWYDNILVGVIGFHDHVSADNRIKIGYWIDVDFEGLVSQSCQALMHYAYTNLNINRIEICAVVGNDASRNVIERLGFVYEGTHQQVQKIYDTYVDHAVYRLLKQEWLQKIKSNPTFIDTLPPLIIYSKNESFPENHSSQLGCSF